MEFRDLKAQYTHGLQGIVHMPVVQDGYYSSRAQYCILLERETQRNAIQIFLKDAQIPTMIYYPIAMSEQEAFEGIKEKSVCSVAKDISKRILALLMRPYLSKQDVKIVVEHIDTLSNKVEKND